MTLRKVGESGDLGIRQLEEVSPEARGGIADARMFVGVDLGGSKIYAGLMEATGKFRATIKELTATSQEGLTEQLPGVVERLLDKGSVGKEEVAAIGVGSPGPLDPDTGMVFDTPNLAIRNFPLVEIMENSLRIPTYMDNDVNVCTLGEALFGAGAGKSSVVGVFVGTGIGGGIVLDGKVFHGASKNAGEIGHMVIQADGAVCGCGGKGHLEAYASKTALAKQFETARAQGRRSLLFEVAEGPYERMNTVVLRDCLEAGDELVKGVLVGAAHALAMGCVSLIHILAPEVIVFGGGVMESVGYFLLPLIQQETFVSCMEGTFEKTQILPSALGDDAGILGAVALARSRRSETTGSQWESPGRPFAGHD
jgi:glucokinase